METDIKTDFPENELGGGAIKKNILGEHFQHNFITQQAPLSQPERNDYYWPKMYNIKKHDFEVIIKPINTLYWRFGFRYSKTEDFPSNNEPRHINKNIIDIHICVGDMRRNRSWHNDNKVYLQSYHVPHKYNPQLMEDKYNGEEIVFIAKWNAKTSQEYYELQSNGRILYQNEFELNNYNFCIFGAWSDFNNYTLSADIKVIDRDK